MTLALAGSLLALALLDSTSFGTLLIPIWFLLAPGRVPVARILVFLGTVVTFYLGLGIALLFGVDALISNTEEWLDSPAVIRGQLILGAGLFVLSFFIGRKKDRNDNGAGAGSGRLSRLRSRALGLDATDSAGEPGSVKTTGGYGGLIALALGAVALEVATMLPYLGAIGLLSTSSLETPGRIGSLALYCVVMVLPALVLLALRVLARRKIEPMLQRIAAWMERSAGEMTAWIVGIVGFFLAGDAYQRLPDGADLFGSLG